VVAVRTCTAVCERVGGWWEITVPELDGRVTQTKRLDQVEETVRSLVSLVVDVPANSFDPTLSTWPFSLFFLTRRAVRQLAGMG